MAQAHSGRGDEEFEATRAKVNQLMDKPVKDKFLVRPPVRFIRNVLLAAVKKQSFARELFSNSELADTTLKTKDGKLWFIAKLVALVGHVTGEPVDITAGKVIAGLEPQKTRAFLCQLIDASTAPAERVITAVHAVRDAATQKKQEIDGATKLQALWRGHATRRAASPTPQATPRHHSHAVAADAMSPVAVKLKVVASSYRDGLITEGQYSALKDSILREEKEQGSRSHTSSPQLFGRPVKDATGEGGGIPQLPQRQSSSRSSTIGSFSRSSTPTLPPANDTKRRRKKRKSSAARRSGSSTSRSAGRSAKSAPRMDVSRAERKAGTPKRGRSASSRKSTKSTSSRPKTAVRVVRPTTKSSVVRAPVPASAQLVLERGGKPMFDQDWLFQFDTRLEVLTTELTRQVEGRSNVATAPGRPKK